MLLWEGHMEGKLLCIGGRVTGIAEAASSSDQGYNARNFYTLLTVLYARRS